MERQSDLEQLVTATLVEHYQTHSPGLIDLVKQLLQQGHNPALVEATVQQHCPPRSVVAAHAYLLAVHYGGTPSDDSVS